MSAGNYSLAQFVPASVVPFLNKGVALVACAIVTKTGVAACRKGIKKGAELREESEGCCDKVAAASKQCTTAVWNKATCKKPQQDSQESGCCVELKTCASELMICASGKNHHTAANPI